MSLWATRDLSLWFSVIHSLLLEKPLSTFPCDKTSRIFTTFHTQEKDGFVPIVSYRIMYTQWFFGSNYLNLAWRAAKSQNSINSRRISDIASCIYYASTSMCSIFLIWPAHSSLHSAMRLRSRHCMLITNVWCTGAFFSNFSRNVIKSFLQPS